MEEHTTSNAAPEGQAAEPVNTETPEVSSNASVAVDSSKAPTDTVKDAAPEFDPKTSYSSLVKELESVNKNYGELRKEYTRRTQYESELKKQIESLSGAFAEATKEKISPEDFIKSIQTQGIDALNPLREQWTNDIRSQYDKALEERDARMAKMEVDLAIMQRRADATNYPDFTKLEPAMQQLLDSPECPVDVDKVGTAQALDTLYKLARSYSMEEAIKQAKTVGEKDAEKRLAKESATAMASGGKSGAPETLEGKSAAELRQHFARTIGISDDV